jgi:hypothetical protein
MTQTLPIFWLTDVNDFLYVSEALNIPQPPSQQSSLSFGQQFLNEPFFFPLQRPFIPPTCLRLLLHLQCKLLHLCPYLFEIFFYLSLAFLLADFVLTTFMAFSSHLHLESSLLENLPFAAHPTTIFTEHQYFVFFFSFA